MNAENLVILQGNAACGLVLVVLDLGCGLEVAVLASDGVQATDEVA